MLSAAFLLDAVKSPPSRGAWIEIEKANVLVTMLGSPPSRGAWIEIRSNCEKIAKPRRRPPRGGRGLK